jgi:hypothetical protein
VDPHYPQGQHGEAFDLQPGLKFGQGISRLAPPFRDRLLGGPAMVA